MAEGRLVETVSLSQCPAWCVADHDDEDLDDRTHVSAGVEVPAVRWVPDPGGGLKPVAGELTLVLWQRGAESGIYAGDGHRQHLELTVESWTRLLAGVSSVVEKAADSGQWHAGSQVAEFPDSTS